MSAQLPNWRLTQGQPVAQGYRSATAGVVAEAGLLDAPPPLTAAEAGALRGVEFAALVSGWKWARVREAARLPIALPEREAGVAGPGRSVAPAAGRRAALKVLVLATTEPWRAPHADARWFPLRT
jgi:hypothetical protein